MAEGTELWKAVDEYLVEHLIPSDPVLDQTIVANTAAGLPSIDVAPNQGKLLHLLARGAGARRSARTLPGRSMASMRSPAAARREGASGTDVIRAGLCHGTQDSRQFRGVIPTNAGIHLAFSQKAWRRTGLAVDKRFPR